MKQLSILKHTVILAILLLTLAGYPVSTHTEYIICAHIKIEIRQEITLERQAFYAHILINNGFGNIFLEDVNEDVLFMRIRIPSHDNKGYSG